MFLPQKDMQLVINAFCSDAAKQGHQDTNSGSLVLKYNETTPNSGVSLSMDWRAGESIENMEENCTKNMNTIMNGKKIHACWVAHET